MIEERTRLAPKSTLRSDGSDLKILVGPLIVGALLWAWVVQPLITVAQSGTQSLSMWVQVNILRLTSAFLVILAFVVMIYVVNWRSRLQSLRGYLEKLNAFDMRDESQFAEALPVIFRLWAKMLVWGLMAGLIGFTGYALFSRATVDFRLSTTKYAYFNESFDMPVIFSVLKRGEMHALLTLDISVVNATIVNSFNGSFVVSYTESEIQLAYPFIATMPNEANITICVSPYKDASGFEIGYTVLRYWSPQAPLMITDPISRWLSYFASEINTYYPTSVVYRKISDGQFISE